MIPSALPPRKLSKFFIGGGAGALFAMAVILLPVNPRYSAGLGKQVAVNLPDGSSMTLNSETEISSQFDKKTRHLDLEKGEAYFRVKHDAAVPFIVKAGPYRVTAVGTAFSIRRYNEQLVVAVEQGTVRIDQGDGVHARLIHAGAVSNASARGVSITMIGSEKLKQNLAWRDGLLSFNQSSLADISAEFNRYNKKKIYVTGVLGQRRMGGVFKATEMDAFVRLLATTDRSITVATLPDGAIRLSQKSAPPQ
jgi:transmembrane sensor